MSHDDTDDLLHRLARSYHTPPETPRDEMWERIEASRARVVPITARSARTRWMRTAAGLAAVLLVGVAIGRLSHRVAASGTLVARAGAPAGDVDTGRAARIVAASTAQPAADDPPSAPAAIENPVRATRGTRIQALADARESASAASTRVSPAAADAGDASGYRLAVLEHMARTEVLLTSFRAQSRGAASDARADAQFTGLARELLQNTRLLLATRQNDDPTLTQLLEDLELVLMQISQYMAEKRRGDLDAINQSLDRRNVIPKLRSTIPASTSPSAGT